MRPSVPSLMRPWHFALAFGLVAGAGEFIGYGLRVVLATPRSAPAATEPGPFWATD
ncbi:hypothetical protein [Psychromicrobium xiongbiense]|uniref:hypothetical protein n=1 Tax=Psychromicrobium xiongbiense TaxID=3051184 RepID=UPI002553EBCF|nr:hypothetical protein [Psychromicrobium sp. YIM S02556]